MPLWTRGDTNAFFGLGFNILVNVLTLTSLLIFVVQVPTSEVLGTVLPALGIALVVGNVYYTYLARRLARRENRTDVTALPYGPSVPHMFIVVFVIMLPIFLATGDPIRAWEAGLAWAFVIGVIVLIGAFIGPYIRRITPRAAMLGTLAGISITFISMRPAAQIWEAAWIGLPVLGIILVGFFTNLRLPGGIPVGLAALLVGTAIGWIGGYMSVPDVTAAAGDIAVAIPSLNIDLLLNGLANLAPLLATAIPLGVYNFAEAMSNVESAAAAGDSYNLRSVLLADGSGAIIGSALGSPFPPAVYIGHPGWKEAGGRASYSMASGVFIAILCFLGLFGLLATVLPIPAIVPILLYIGLLIGAQAFQAVPRIQAAAVVAALIPNIAAWGTSLMDNALAAAGTTAGEVGAEALGSAGLVTTASRSSARARCSPAWCWARWSPSSSSAGSSPRQSQPRSAPCSAGSGSSTPVPSRGRRARRSRWATRCSRSCWALSCCSADPGRPRPTGVEAGHADAGHDEHAEAGHASAERSGSASARPATESG